MKRQRVDWTAAESLALRQGMSRYQFSSAKFEDIMKDPSFQVLSRRSASSLRDRWRHVEAKTQLGTQDTKLPNQSNPWTKPKPDPPRPLTFRRLSERSEEPTAAPSMRTSRTHLAEQQAQPGGECPVPGVYPSLLKKRAGPKNQEPVAPSSSSLASRAPHDVERVATRVREGFQLSTAKRKKFQRRFQVETSATPEICANSFIGAPPGFGFRDGSYFWRWSDQPHEGDIEGGICSECGEDLCEYSDECDHCGTFGTLRSWSDGELNGGGDIESE